jgi:antigen flippase
MIVSTIRVNLAIQVIAFATSIMLARILGPTGRGEFALVLLYPQLVAGIAFMGVDRGVAILSGRGELTRPVETINKLVVIFSIPAILAGYSIILWRVPGDHLESLAKLYLLYVPAVYFFLLVTSLLNGKGDFVRFNQTRLGFYLINFALVLVIWLTGLANLPQLDLLIMANLSAVYGVMALSILMLRELKTTSLRSKQVVQSKGDVRNVLSIAILFMLPITLAQLSSFAPQIALEHSMDIQALGFFVVYLSYSRLLSPIGSSINSYIFHLGITGAKEDVARIFRLSMLVYLACAFPFWLLAGWLIPIFFGRTFVVDGDTIGAMLISTLFTLLADSMAEYLNGKRKVVPDIIGRILFLITLAILGICWVQSYGLFGIALAMVIGDMIRCCILVTQVSFEIKRPLKEFWQITRVDIYSIIKRIKTH